MASEFDLFLQARVVSRYSHCNVFDNITKTFYMIRDDDYVTFLELYLKYHKTLSYKLVEKKKSVFPFCVLLTFRNSSQHVDIPHLVNYASEIVDFVADYLAVDYDKVNYNSYHCTDRCDSIYLIFNDLYVNKTTYNEIFQLLFDYIIEGEGYALNWKDALRNLSTSSLTMLGYHGYSYLACKLDNENGKVHTATSLTLQDLLASSMWLISRDGTESIDHELANLTLSTEN